MSVETVKLLYNDVNNDRFSASQYDNFKKVSINTLYVLRPDLYTKTVSVPIKKNLAGMAQADIPAGSDYVKFKGVIKDTDAKSPRLVDFPEALAKDPDWGRHAGEKLDEISEYCVDIMDSTTCLYFDKLVDGAQAVIQVTSPADPSYVSAWVDVVLDKYMLYLCYSADSTSQADQQLAQQYLQEFKQLAMTQKPATVSDKTPYPMQTVSAQAQQQQQGAQL